MLSDVAQGTWCIYFGRRHRLLGLYIYKSLRCVAKADMIVQGFGACKKCLNRHKMKIRTRRHYLDHFSVCVFVCAHVHDPYHEVRGRTEECVHSLHHVKPGAETQKTWQQVSLPAELSHWP